MEANGMKQQDEGTVRYREPYKPGGVLIIIAVLLVLAGIVLSKFLWQVFAFIQKQIIPN